MKQTAGYFSNKNGFIQDQQRISIWDLQPWWTHTSSYKKWKELILEEKGKLREL